MYTIFIDAHFLTFNCLQFLRIKLIYIIRTVTDVVKKSVILLDTLNRRGCQMTEIHI